MFFYFEVFFSSLGRWLRPFDRHLRPQWPDFIALSKAPLNNRCKILFEMRSVKAAVSSHSKTLSISLGLSPIDIDPCHFFWHVRKACCCLLDLSRGDGHKQKQQTAQNLKMMKEYVPMRAQTAIKRSKAAQYYIMSIIILGRFRSFNPRVFTNLKPINPIFELALVCLF